MLVSWYKEGFVRSRRSRVCPKGFLDVGQGGLLLGDS